jgi:hypothetical protein
MSRPEDIELDELLNNERQSNSFSRRKREVPSYSSEETVAIPEDSLGRREQWTTTDNKIYIPTGKTVRRLPPAFYGIGSNPQIGIYLEKLPIKTEGLLRFPQTNFDNVVAEIQRFWTMEERYKEFELIYKRGILLWGPPGSGKSCIIQLIMQDVIDREGIVLQFCAPGVFIDGLRIVRDIQPETPIVVLMEDIDSILETYQESMVLNILDGVEMVNKIVFLATTNYPEELGSRIINRPSRFDKRYKIEYPNSKSRKIYFEHLFKRAQWAVDKYEKDIDTWVKDTEGMSIAHLRELFVAVVILGNAYDDAISVLRSMKDRVRSTDDKLCNMGFRP